MNTNELRELEGKELAVKVATDVMRWKVARDWSDDQVRDFWIDKDVDDPECVSFDYYVDEFRPDRDISAAWAVVGRMEGLYGFDAHNGFTIINNKRDYSGWYVEFPLPNWEYAEASIAPEAICLAALKAVGG